MIMIMMIMILILIIMIQRSAQGSVPRVMAPRPRSGRCSRVGGGLALGPRTGPRVGWNGPTKKVEIDYVIVCCYSTLLLYHYIIVIISYIYIYVICYYYYHYILYVPGPALRLLLLLAAAAAGTALAQPHLVRGVSVELGKGQMGSALMVSLQISCLFDRRPFWVLALTVHYLCNGVDATKELSIGRSVPLDWRWGVLEYSLAVPNDAPLVAVHVAIASGETSAEDFTGALKSR